MARKEMLKKIARQSIPNVGTVLVVIALLWAQQVGAFGFLQSAPTSTSTTTISYQGRLADSAGTPITGTLGMTFRIYNVSTGGSPLWTETYPGVQFSDGLFHVLLGGYNNPIPNSLFVENDTLYLGITVGTDDEMVPREQLASAPYAMHALTVPDRSITNEKVGLSYWYVSHSDSIDIYSTDQYAPDEISSLTVDFPVDGVYLVVAKVCSYSDSADTTLVASIWDESTRISENTWNTHPKQGIGGMETATLTTIIPFPAGAHTIRLMAYNYVGTTHTVVAPATEFIVVPLGQP